MLLVYFLISILATTLGAMAGLGGGVIIKPLLDFLGDFNLSTISVLSSATVFSMAIVSIIKQIRYKVDIQVKKTVLIGFGSIFGGLFGEQILRFILSKFDTNLVMIVQNGTLAALLILIYIYMNNKSKFKSYNVQNSIVCLIIGVVLGLVASFLSIGGGPINVCILTIFFSMEAKEAAVNSIITILFSQGSKLTTIALTTGFSSLDLSMLPVMIVGGILGGLIGSKFNKVFSNDIILRVFNIVVAALILLNIYNVIAAVI
ncbi:MAG: sulfite exporter TauE/SafE family protein [Clostridium sp.]